MLNSNSVIVSILDRALPKFEGWKNDQQVNVCMIFPDISPIFSDTKESCRGQVTVIHFWVTQDAHKIPFYLCEVLLMNVGIGLTFFNSSEDYAKFVDNQLIDLKTQFQSHSKMLDDVHRRSNSSGPQASSKQSSIKPNNNTTGNTRQIQADAFKVLLNPSAEYEASVLDEAILAIQEKIEKLEKIQKHVIPLLKNGSRLAVIVMDDVPTAFMYYERI